MAAVGQAQRSASPPAAAQLPPTPCLGSILPRALLGACVPASSASRSFGHGLLDHDPLHAPPRTLLIVHRRGSVSSLSRSKDAKYQDVEDPASSSTGMCGYLHQRPVYAYTTNLGVPRETKYSDDMCTSTPEDLGCTKFHYRRLVRLPPQKRDRQDWTDKYPENVGTSTVDVLFVKSLYENVSHYHRPNVYETCTMTVAEDPMDVKFRVVTPNIDRHEPLLPLTTRERLLPL
ncbi:uncharacterized protein [Triticum aestivum]|uniref:uncharacterized protein n=1 Tax=Triticum aestivum TaxID=4565 RepID=UPI001D0231B7|nr:uncharacterized protein LOC123130588 [Triticum aestivum]